MAFLSSLIYTGTRVGGQRERQTQSFESSSPFFPRDFPSTFAYDEFVDDRAEQEEESWKKKPRAKRPGWERLGVRSPWKADWEVVLGLQQPQRFREAHTHVEEDLVTAMRDQLIFATEEGASQELMYGFTVDEDEQLMEIDTKEETVGPWLLRGQGVTNLILSFATSACPSARRPETFFEFINNARIKHGLLPLPSQAAEDADVQTSPDDLYRRALVRVAIRMCGKGCPSDMAIIYNMQDEELATFNRSRAARNAPLSSQNDLDEEAEVGLMAVLCLTNLYSLERSNQSRYRRKKVL